MKIVNTDALLIVDVQNDFCPGGALGVNNGNKIVPIINELQNKFENIILTRDLHPENHCSFSKNPEFIDGSWPEHCVKNTNGAEFHPKLIVPQNAPIISKAQNPRKDSYSGFDEADLMNILKEKNIRRLFIVGIATDYCVKFTAIDALKNKFEVFIILQACAAVDVPPGSANLEIEKLKAMGVNIINPKELQ